MTSLIDIDGDDASKYRLIGDRVLSYRFAVPHDERLYLGDVLVVAHPVSLHALGALGKMKGLPGRAASTGDPGLGIDNHTVPINPPGIG